MRSLSFPSSVVLLRTECCTLQRYTNVGICCQKAHPEHAIVQPRSSSLAKVKLHSHIISPLVFILTHPFNPYGRLAVIVSWWPSLTNILLILFIGAGFFCVWWAGRGGGGGGGGGAGGRELKFSFTSDLNNPVGSWQFSPLPFFTKSKPSIGNSVKDKMHALTGQRALS